MFVVKLLNQNFKKKKKSCLVSFFAPPFKISHFKVMFGSHAIEKGGRESEEFVCYFVKCKI